MDSTQNLVDISRWNRKTRREIKKNSDITIPGRNLPYVKAIHGTVEAYNNARNKELSQEKNG